jgi:hypothetical protein
MILLATLLATPVLGAATWSTVPYRHCNDNKFATQYTSLASAEAACLALASACSGVYDQNCKGSAFYACKLAPFAYSGGGSCRDGRHVRQPAVRCLPRRGVPRRPAVPVRRRRREGRLLLHQR